MVALPTVTGAATLPEKLAPSQSGDKVATMGGGKGASPERPWDGPNYAQRA
jgi:hypothetical protein